MNQRDLRTRPTSARLLNLIAYAATHAGSVLGRTLGRSGFNSVRRLTGGALASQTLKAIYPDGVVIFPALEKCPGPATEKLCRDYLALSDMDARPLGPPQFEEAARALLAVSPRTETALELMKHRLQEVRGRAILDCLKHAQEPWAKAALEKGAPHALAYHVE